MPFKSKQQSKWAFATHQEWADKWAKQTDYKNLPMKLRGKKKQTGGMYNLDGSWSPGYYDKKTDSWVSTGETIPAKNTPLTNLTIPVDNQNPAWTNYTPIVSTPVNPYADQQDGQLWHGTQVQGYDDFVNGLPDNHPDKPINSQPAGTNSTLASNPSVHSKNWSSDIFFGLRGAQMAASFLAEKKRNARMNQYDYKQQTALGIMNPMPVSQFQFSSNDYTTPNNMYAQNGGIMNPYLYYSKYGGNLKTILREHGKWSNNSGPMDMTDGKESRYPEKKKGGFALDEMVVRDFISKLMEFGNGPHPYSGIHTKRAEEGGQLNTQNMIYLRRGGNPAKRRVYPRAQQGQQQSGQQAQIMQLIQMYAQMTGNSPQKIMQQLQQMQPQQQQAAIQQMAQAVQQAQGQGQMMQGDTDQDQMAQGGNWLQGAVNPAHRGWCTPMSNPHCTGRRRQFALMMKKHHGFHE